MKNKKTFITIIIAVIVLCFIVFAVSKVNERQEYLEGLNIDMLFYRTDFLRQEFNSRYPQYEFLAHEEYQAEQISDNYYYVPGYVQFAAGRDQYRIRFDLYVESYANSLFDADAEYCDVVEILFYDIEECEYFEYVD